MLCACVGRRCNTLYAVRCTLKNKLIFCVEGKLMDTIYPVKMTKGLDECSRVRDACERIFRILNEKMLETLDVELIW